MTLRVLSIVCFIIGHKRNADTRRNENGSVFATCSRCSRTLYRDPIKGKWRAATTIDQQPRGFALTEERETIVVPKRVSRRRR